MAGTALLPLRIFLGGTFLYAGLDKLLDPTFLMASGAGSIGDQLHEFVRTSPLAPLVQLVALPFPIMVGLGMALLEISIGLATLAGWLYRPAATAGMAVALLFYLTASWTVHPYFLGPDLPYAAGWLTLSLAGDGGLWTLERWLAGRNAVPSRAAHGRRPEPTVSTERRRFLQLAALGAATLLVGGPAAALGRIAGAARQEQAIRTVPTASAASSATATPSAAASTTPPSTAGTLLARGSQLHNNSAVLATDPNTGDPVQVIRLPSNSVVAYDALCTHAGCTVDYDPSSATLICPCHGAQFDPAHQAQVLGGPTNQPLAAVAIRVDPASGDVRTA